MKSTAQSCKMGGTILVIVYLMFATANAQQVAGQQSPGASTQEAGASRYTELELKMQTVIAALDDTRRQLHDSEQRIDQLQAELKLLQGKDASANKDDQSQAPALAAAVEGLKDQSEIVQSEVKQLDQTKVETTSKFPLRLNGMILFNTFANDGSVDNNYLPTIALARTGDAVHNYFGASMSQSIIGLTAFGPQIWGAHSSADVQIDFFNAAYGTTNPSSATARFRTAHVGLDWENTSVSTGVSTPLISPLNPTSYATVAEAAMTWAGNLWFWMPEIKVEQRIPTSATSHVGLEFGLLDPAYITLPGAQTVSYAVQSSIRPGYESRLSYNWKQGLDQFGLGLGGYYGRTEYAYGQGINSWAVTGDWNLPLSKWLALSGELYRGNAIGQLGGGVFKNVLPIPNSELVRGLDAEGGWSQLKFRFNPRLEGNFSIGQDTGYGGQIRSSLSALMMAASATPQYSPYTYLARNRSTLENIIYRPKAYLLFSAEHRNIQSWPVNAESNKAQIWTLSAGYLF